MSIPAVIPIRREPNYHTHYIGRYSGRRQYMAFVVATLPIGTQPQNWGVTKRWYAVIHLFDKFGAHLETRHRFAGTTSEGEPDVIRRAHRFLAELLDELPSRTFGNIKVGLFKTLIDGYVFGLVEASEPSKEYERVDLLPNGLAFFAPWNGIYDT